MRSFALYALLALAVAVAGCDGFSPEAARLLPDLTPTEAEVVTADNAFGLDLLRTLSAEAPDENLFISPTSVSMALGMALNGAEGETRAQMEAVLRKRGLSQTEINEAYRSLIDLLRGLDPEVVMDVANSIWTREGFPVEPAFIDANRQYFDAEVAALDFSDPGAPGVINAWVREKTRGRIEEIVDQIGADVVMYLINAIYFKGTWTYEFDEALTEEAPFHLAAGGTVDVPLMQQEADLPYLRTDRFRAVDLPYGDSLYSMTVLLPHPGVPVADVVEALTPEAWAAWSDSFQVQPVHLRLPRFRLEYKQALNEALQALGMADAFDVQRADFSGIHPDERLAISRVLHRTFLEVNEEGTEAAAVTAVEVVVVCAGCGGPMPFIVDRPFVLMIRERHSGTILFAGQVVDPSAS